jgi:lipopolysaccharide/colanic/teichoic acid biosynthesis glycosyltransferase
VFVLAALAIKIDSRGPIFYRQWRVGKNGKEFRLFKFRTMYASQHRGPLITTSDRDKRITPVGFYLRKYKIDELPQLLNVLAGSMSIVGPRPELREYVNLYTNSQRLVLQKKPGMTDIASLIFINENEILKHADDPEQFYLKEILPLKIRLNKVYIIRSNAGKYFSIICWTIFSIFHITNPRLKQIDLCCKSRILANTGT